MVELCLLYNQAIKILNLIYQFNIIRAELPSSSSLDIRGNFDGIILCPNLLIDKNLCISLKYIYDYYIIDVGFYICFLGISI